MKLCIPTDDGAGLGGRLSSHFGRAPYFTVIESGTGVPVVLPNGRARHEHGECGHAASAFEGHGVEAVVCRGVGRRALAGLAERGVAVFVTDASTVAEAVLAFGDGRLTPVTVEEACAGGHGHGDVR
jgi:predicted Fe-Mo cluster-binding NifX family protein